MQWYHIKIVFLALGLLVYATFADCQSELSSAERVAKDYMAAFYQGDFEKSCTTYPPGHVGNLKANLSGKT